MTLLRTHVRSHELGLRFHRGELERVLGPGDHWQRFGRVDVVANRLDLRFTHRLLPVLVEHGALRAHLDVVDLTDQERALVFQAGRLVEVLGPGLHAFWKQTEPLVIERYDVNTPRFEHRALDVILRSPETRGHLCAIRPSVHEEVVLYRDGAAPEVIGPGTYAYWLAGPPVTWVSVDRRVQTLDVAGQEIMTQDKVTLRVNLVVEYRVVDPLRSTGAAPDAAQAIYRSAQLALRAAVGARSLEALLTGKDEVTDEVRGALAKRAAELGLGVEAVGLRDVILPGDMKQILNQVIEAEKQSEANLIRRREETAAARSQANTAKLIAQNPVLMRMKELEQLGQVLAGTRATFVLGGGDLAAQVRGLVPASEDEVGSD